MKELKRVRSGRLVSAVIYTMATAGEPARVRAQQKQASSEARERLNARTSYAKLERVLAANFDNGDLLVTLTYDDQHLPEDRDKAVRRFRSFAARLRAIRKPRGQPVRYVYVVEGCFPGGRLHHHMVLNSTGSDFDDLREAWRYGIDIDAQPLVFNDLYTYADLASYLTKEPREWGHPQVGERTWTPSIGLAKPEPERSTVPEDMTLAAPPGAVVLNSEGPVRNGWGEFTWIKYMLPYDPEARPRPKAKRRRKSKKE